MRILALRSPGTRGLGRKADAFVPSLRSKSLPQTLFCSFQYNVYSNVLVMSSLQNINTVHFHRTQTVGAEQKDSLFLEPNRRILYYRSRTEGFFTSGAEQKDSLLLAPSRRIHTMYHVPYTIPYTIYHAIYHIPCTIYHARYHIPCTIYHVPHTPQEEHD